MFIGVNHLFLFFVIVTLTLTVGSKYHYINRPSDKQLVSVINDYYFDKLTELWPPGLEI